MNCTYYYENGVSKSIKLHGEYAETRREHIRGKRQKGQGRTKREARISASQNAGTTAEENLLDEDPPPKISGDKDDESSQEEPGLDSVSNDIVDDGGNGSNAGGESENEHPHQGHDRKGDHRSYIFDKKKSKPYDNSTQEGATDCDADSPDDQDEWEESESSPFKDPRNEPRSPDPKDNKKRAGHNYGDRVGSRSLSSPDPARWGTNKRDAGHDQLK